MVRTQIQLTEPQAQALRELAAQQRTSIAELIRQGVELLLQSTRTTDDMREKRRWAKLVSGLFRSGLPDLGRNHDYYLAEAISHDPRDLKVIDESFLAMRKFNYTEAFAFDQHFEEQGFTCLR
jgi:hypothetical protein